MRPSLRQILFLLPLLTAQLFAEPREATPRPLAPEIRLLPRYSPRSPWRPAGLSATGSGCLLRMASMRRSCRLRRPLWPGTRSRLLCPAAGLFAHILERWRSLPRQRARAGGNRPLRRWRSHRTAAPQRNLHHALEYRQLHVRKRRGTPALSVPPVDHGRPPGRHVLRRPVRFHVEIRAVLRQGNPFQQPGPGVSRVGHRPRIPASRAQGPGRTHRHHAAAAALGARLPPVPLLLLPRLAGARGRREFRNRQHPLRCHLDGHRLHGRLPLLHLRPEAASPTRRSSTPTCTRRASIPSG